MALFKSRISQIIRRLSVSMGRRSITSLLADGNPYNYGRGYSNVNANRVEMVGSHKFVISVAKMKIDRSSCAISRRKSKMGVI
jgi:hypothetical protein